MIAVTEIKSRFRGVSGSGPELAVSCPYHHDENPSATVNIEKEVFACHAGSCGVGKHLAEVWRDHGWGTYPGSDGHARAPSKSWPYWEHVGEQRFIFDYRDTSDQVVLRVYRWEGQEIGKIVRPIPPGADPTRPDSWRIPKGLKVPLFNRKAFMEAASRGGIVGIAEGEKKSLSVSAHGIPCACNHGGSSNWKDDLLDGLPRASKVVVFVDADAAGAKWRDAVCRSVVSHGGEPYIPDMGFKAGSAKDVDDWFKEHDPFAVDEDFGRLVASAQPWVASQETEQEQLGEGKRQLPETHTSADLLSMVFPEPVWLVPGIIPEGLTLLAGAPKVGKSWLALQLAAALSIGGRVLGSIKVQKQPVLYLALEDRPRRLQNRMQMLKVAPGPDFHYSTEWRRGTEGVEDLDAWLEIHPDVRVVIVDVLEKIRGSRGNQGMYEADYQAVSSLKSLADRRGISIVVLHHDRKMIAGDWLDSVSGSKGLTGCADTVLLLKKQIRREAQAELSVTGRDVEDAEHALSFQEDLGWTILGDAQEFRCTREQGAIVAALKSIAKPAGAKAVAEIVDKSRQNVQNQLARMLAAGTVKTDGKGHYELSNKDAPHGDRVSRFSCVSPETQETQEKQEKQQTQEKQRERGEEEIPLWEGFDPTAEPDVSQEEVPLDIF
jgi:hypothetical protein